MTVLSPRTSVGDLVRAVVVAVLGVVQAVVSALGGTGTVGESVGSVARDLATPLLPAGWAFGIWGLIHLGFLGYAGYQLLPGQRARAVHRDTGWWLAAAAVLNPAWVLAFGARFVLLAEVLLIGLLVCLAVVLGRLSRVPADGVVERVVFRGTVALYAGWVSVATVLGTAATGVWIGLPADGPMPVLAAVLVLVVTAAIASWVVTAGTSVVGYAAAVLWAFAGIALGAAPTAVAVAAVLAGATVAAAVARRITAAGSPVRAAWG